MMYQLHIRPEVMRREKMLNICAVLVPHFKNFRANGPAILHQLLTRSPRFLLRHLSAAPHSSLQNGEEPPQPPPERRRTPPSRSDSACSNSIIRWVNADGPDSAALNAASRNLESTPSSSSHRTALTASYCRSKPMSSTSKKPRCSGTGTSWICAASA